MTTAAYWNVLSKATKPKVRKKIRPLKRDDDSLAVNETEKANLLYHQVSSTRNRSAIMDLQLFRSFALLTHPL